MHFRDLKMKTSRESNNNKQQKEIIMNIPNTNKPRRNHAAALLGAAFLCVAAAAQAAPWTFNLARGCTAQNTAAGTALTPHAARTPALATPQPGRRPLAAFNPAAATTRPC